MVYAAFAAGLERGGSSAALTPCHGARLTIKPTMKPTITVAIRSRGGYRRSAVGSSMITPPFGQTAIEVDRGRIAPCDEPDRGPPRHSGRFGEPQTGRG